MSTPSKSAPAEGGLEVEGDGAARRGVGGREQSSRGNRTDIASVPRVFHAESVTPPGPVGLFEQRLAGRRLGKGFGEVEGDAGEGLKAVEGELTRSEFGVVGVGELGFVLLPDAGLGGRGANVEADASGDEIGVSRGGRSSGFAIQGADRREGISIDTSCCGMQVLELAGDAQDAEVVADGDEGRVALDTKPALVLAVDGMASESAVGTETIEVLGVEIEVSSGDE